MALKHQLIREQLLAEISTMETDAPIAQERELADRFGVSRTTVRQALRSLSDEGLIYAIRGQGTFVSGGRISKGLKLSSFSEDMRSRGMIPRSRLIRAEEKLADADLAQQLEVEVGTPVLMIERLRLADGVPMCLETTHLPKRLFPHLLNYNLDGSLYNLLADHYRVRVELANQRITTLASTSVVSDLLGIPRKSPALRVDRQGVDDKGRIVEYAVSLYRPDRYDYRFTVHR